MVRLFRRFVYVAGVAAGTLKGCDHTCRQRSTGSARLRSPEALLGALLGESVARADLIPRGTGLAGGLNLGGLQFLRRFSQPPVTRR
jgi:hypothetical protein